MVHTPHRFTVARSRIPLRSVLRCATKRTRQRVLSALVQNCERALSQNCERTLVQRIAKLIAQRIAKLLIAKSTTASLCDTDVQLHSVGTYASGGSNGSNGSLDTQRPTTERSNTIVQVSLSQVPLLASSLSPSRSDRIYERICQSAQLDRLVDTLLLDETITDEQYEATLQTLLDQFGMP